MGNWVFQQGQISWARVLLGVSALLTSHLAAVQLGNVQQNESHLLL